MEEKQTKTADEKRLEKISQLKARLQMEEARLKESERKERNGQLIAFGVLLEQVFKASKSKQEWIEAAHKHLNDRNLQRALAGFQRLEK